MINTKDLIKSFGDNIVLDELCLHVPKGISGFVGRNGAGKTTTIGILLGLLKPKSGAATIFGLDCWEKSFEIRKNLGVMHENNPYPGSFTSMHLLEHVGRFYGLTNPRQKAKETLHDVGLSGNENKPIKTFSAGMFRRLGLAQALIGEPKLIILDEPTANIDPSGRISLLNKIVELHKEKNISFFITTHMLSDLEKICDWLSIIDRGKIVDQGHVRDLAKKYSANLFKIEVSEPHRFLEKLKNIESVENPRIEGDFVYCKVKNPDEFYSKLPRLTSELNLQLKGFQRIIGTIEEIYGEITNEQK
ncbi:MAG: ABC transporter ATP-binding protein [Candidatus Bathyarchaeota archaeon]|nr:ABC transporter ATP-binding protein [Candidatus Bathyarchaeum tardum]